MRRGLALVVMLAAACSSSRKTDELPAMVPPAQPLYSTPTVESQVAALQTSMTELLERIDVLNARIAKLESGGQAIPPVQQSAAPAPSPRAATAPQPPPQPKPKPAVVASADVADAYQKALMLIGQGKQADARAAFQQVFDADPNGQLADNALFWIGETYFAAGDYPNAMRYYQRVINEFPGENKAPDAMFKLAMAYVKTGDVGMARRTLGDCIKKYPYSAPAASAKLELQRISY
jgi:tol-pal system protein YbgF